MRRTAAAAHEALPGSQVNHPPPDQLSETDALLASTVQHLSKPLGGGDPTLAHPARIFGREGNSASASQHTGLQSTHTTHGFESSLTNTVHVPATTHRAAQKVAGHVVRKQPAQHAADLDTQQQDFDNLVATQRQKGGIGTHSARQLSSRSLLTSFSRYSSPQNSSTQPG